MTQLCLWTKIRTKQWIVLGASPFQCMRAGFFCPKCDNFACLHTRQNQNELQLKRWFFFAKIGSFCKSIARPLPSVAQAYTQQPYSFGGRIKLIICQIRHGICITIHEVSTIWKKNVRWLTLCKVWLISFKICGLCINWNIKFGYVCISKSIVNF